MRARRAALDLGTADVHVPSSGGGGKRKTMAEISTKKRNALPAGKFALPEQRKYPIHDAAHVRNAAARLEQAKKAGKISGADYAKAKRAIGAAAKRFGVDSEYSAPKRAPRAASGLRMAFEHPVHGRFEIRHMRDGSACLRLAFPLDPTAAGDGPTWVQIALPGHFEGHRAGPFDLDDRVFRDIIRNYREVDGGEVAFDFEHASESDAADGAIPVAGAPAQGWIKDLKLDAGNLYALVDWLEPARGYIREGKYKYVSPAIRFNARHPVTGKSIGARLTSVALTNQPFLRGLQPLAAKDTPMTEAVDARDGAQTYAYSSHEYMPKLRAALRLPELATARECSEAMDRLADHYAAGGGAPVHGVPVHEFVNGLRDAMQVPMTSTVEEIFEAVNEMIAAAIAEHEHEYHEVEPAMADDDEETEMSDAEKAKLKDVEAKNEALSTSLKAAEEKIAARDTLLASKDEQIAKLTSELKARDEKDDEARVAKAHADYQHKKPMSVEARRALLKADRAMFEKEFPALAPGQEHMLHDLTGKRPPEIEAAPDPVAKMSTVELTKHLMSTEKLDYLSAQNKALHLKRAAATR